MLICWNTHQAGIIIRYKETLQTLVSNFNSSFEQHYHLIVLTSTHLPIYTDISFIHPANHFSTVSNAVNTQGSLQYSLLNYSISQMFSDFFSLVVCLSVTTLNLFFFEMQIDYCCSWTIIRSYLFS